MQFKITMLAIRSLPTRPPGSNDVRYFKLPYIGNFRSEEHTSELQSRQYLVCRLLLEKKKKTNKKTKKKQKKKNTQTHARLTAT